MRPRWSLVTLLLGCARGELHGSDGDREVEVQAAPASLTASDEQALRAAIAAHGPLYWRLRDPAGPRCEAWRLEPDADDPAQGRLVRVDEPLRLSFRYLLADGLLRLYAPSRERELSGPDGSLSVASLSLPCVFSGMSQTPADPAAPRRLVLASHERWFLDEQRCAAAGPDEQPQPTAPGELHPVGCASALADPATRARPEPSAPGPAAKALHASRRVFWLRRRAGALRCEAWQHEAGDAPQRGLLRRSDRDEHGRRSLVYSYAIGGDVITLLGPNEFREVRGKAGPAEQASTRGCLLTRPLALTPDALKVGDESWYLRRSACEQARATGVAALPDPDCGPPH
jgi:hypothetical protein